MGALVKNIRRISNVLSEGPVTNSRRRAFASSLQNSPYIFQVVASLPTKAC